MHVVGEQINGHMSCSGSRLYDPHRCREQLEKPDILIFEETRRHKNGTGQDQELHGQKNDREEEHAGNDKGGEEKRMIIRLPEPISGGLILSYKCSAECLHCMYACSPGWSGDWIPETDLETILAQLAGRILPSPYGPEAVGTNFGLHLTGGEPFLNYELLCRATEIARERDIPSTFVETNCFWCTDDETTREKLRNLKDKGIRGIMISVNPFYLEYVPLERTDRAIMIGLEIFGDNVMVYQVEYYRRFKAMGIEGRVAFEEYLRKLEEKDDFLRNVEFFVMGRASYKLRTKLGDLLPTYPARYLSRRPCAPPFLRDWHNHFDNYGNYIPGYCGGISLGDCRQLDRLLAEGIDTEEYPVLGFLLKEDVMGLLQFSRGFGYKELQDGYLSKCHLCTDVRKHLVTNGEFKELRPQEFYSRLE
jgi:hypothetical protein